MRGLAVRGNCAFGALTSFAPYGRSRSDHLYRSEERSQEIALLFGKENQAEVVSGT
jgi:hypothetical protein